MKILNKTDSLNQIKRLGLNTVPEIVVSPNSLEKIDEFVKKYPASQYVLRDNSTALGKYFYATKDEIKELAKNYTSPFSLAVSFYSYGGITLIGDILVSGDRVELTASTDSNANHRNADEISIYSNLYDDKLWRIPGFNDLIKYIADKNLMDIIVEFVVFDHKVGTKKEKVLITELRTEY